ncbi:MAG: O-antigen ligase family protein [Candidatus Omnitrophica bacterium]|nr:O-antigen ligase family protein [Candidatus Omnitrophota bacterium]
MTIPQEMKIPTLIFIAALISSCLLSQDKIISLAESYKYSIGLLLFFIGLSMPEDKKEKAITVLFYAGVVISVLALYQYAFGFGDLKNYLASHGLNDEFIQGYIERKRVFKPFFSPNMLAGYLAMIAPLGLLQAKRRWFLVPVAIALILTQSIGAFASIILAAFCVFALKPATMQMETQDGLAHLVTSRRSGLPHSSPGKPGVFCGSGGKKPILLAVICIGLAAILWIRVSDPAVFRQPGFSIQMRFEYWAQALSLIKEHPIVGSGVGIFKVASTRYAHNLLLQIWAESGILGVFSIVFFIGRLLQLAKKRIISSKPNPLLIPLFSGVLFFLFHNLWDISFFFPETVFIWWLLAGLLIS